MAYGRPGDIKEICLNGFTIFRQKYLLGKTEGGILEKRERKRQKEKGQKKGSFHRGKLLMLSVINHADKPDKPVTQPRLSRTLSLPAGAPLGCRW